MLQARVRQLGKAGRQPRWARLLYDQVGPTSAVTAAKYAGERPGEWAAIWVTVVLVTFSAKVGDDLEIVPILAMGAMVAGSLLLLMRVGMLAFVVLQHLFISFIFELPVTLELSAWYGQPTVLFLLMVALLTSYGFYVSLGGRPMFGEAFLAE